MSPENQEYEYGTGRRKTAVARVRLFSTSSGITINGRSIDEYFPRILLRKMVLEPLQVTGTLGKVGLTVTVAGGGICGQAGAVRHGVARALLDLDPNHRAVLKKNGLLTRDPRVKERKKYGLKRARKAPQYTKR